MEKCCKIENGNLVEVFSPSHTRTFCFIDTALDQMYKLTTCDDAINDIFNIGQEKPEIKIFSLVEKIIKIIKKDLKIKKMENTLGSPERRCPSMKKTYKVLKNIKEVSLEKVKDYLYVIKKTIIFNERNCFYTHANNRTGFGHLARCINISEILLSLDKTLKIYFMVGLKKL